MCVYWPHLQSLNLCVFIIISYCCAFISSFRPFCCIYFLCVLSRVSSSFQFYQNLIYMYHISTSAIHFFFLQYHCFRMRRYSTSIFSFSRFSRTFLYLGWWSDDDKRKKNRKSKKIISVLTLFGREYNWSNSNTAPTSFKSHYFSFICTFVHINLAKFVWRLYNNKLLNGGWFLYFFFFFSFDKSLCVHIKAPRASTVCGWQSVERYAFMWVDESSFFILFHDELLHIFVFSFFSHACSLVFIIAFGCLPTHYKKGVFKP